MDNSGTTNPMDRAACVPQQDHLTPPCDEIRAIQNLRDTIMDSFRLSPINNNSVLNDDTDIEEPECTTNPVDRAAWVAQRDLTPPCESPPVRNFKDYMDSFGLSPIKFPTSSPMLTDSTDIEEPESNSWWKKLNDSSRDIMEALENDIQEAADNKFEESWKDLEVFSCKLFTQDDIQVHKLNVVQLLGLKKSNSDSSDGESISSIIVQRRQLFPQKENQQNSKFKARLLKCTDFYSSDDNNKPVIDAKVFAFPSAGNKAGEVKRKYNFADFIASESEEEPENREALGIRSANKKIINECQEVESDVLVKTEENDKLEDTADEMKSFTISCTSNRKTSIMESQNITPSLLPLRGSTEFSEGTQNSSAEGSSWDHHRTTRRTLRKTNGRESTPRKSLKALLRHPAFTANDVGVPQANSTELPGDTRDVHEYKDQHDVSKRMRRTTVDTKFHNIKKKNMEERKNPEEKVRNCLKAPARLLATRDSLNDFNVPSGSSGLKRVTEPAQQPKKTVKSTIPLDELPQEFVEDMKAKPPKCFKPRNAPWINKRLYTYLENELAAKYGNKARGLARKLVETLYDFTKEVRKHTVAPSDAVEVLKHEMAQLKIVRTHFDFYRFCYEYLPRDVQEKVMLPDMLNEILLPRDGISADPKAPSGNSGQ